MKRFLRILLAVVLVFLLVLLLFLRLRYGGGREYDFDPGPARLGAEALAVYYTSPEPVGNVAASRDTAYPTRVFMTIHPESRPAGWKLLEITGGEGRPYPSAEAQEPYFTTVLGLYVDRFHRLWTIDHGNHGAADVRLLAFDLRTDSLVHDYVFSREVAELGSFFNDLSVTPDGRYVFIADVSFFRKAPSLVVYDTREKKARSLLDDHPSVAGEGYVPVAPAKKMRFFGGLVDLMPGIDGLDLSPDGRYVYYAPMTHSGLFRLPVAAAADFDRPPAAVAEQVERVADKPLSDGIRVDTAGRVLVTDIEHRGIYLVDPDGENYTLLRDERIRWADGLSFGSDGYWYLADSAIPEQMLQSKKHIQEEAPYYVFRFRY